MRYLLLVLLATACDGAGGGVLTHDCSSHTTMTVTVPMPADLPMEFRIETCRMDADACVDLCQLALERNGVSNATSISCDVTFAPDQVAAKIAYLPAECSITPQGGVGGL